MQSKKRNPTDATIRNVQALNKKVEKLIADKKDLVKRIKVLEKYMRADKTWS